MSISQVSDQTSNDKPVRKSKNRKNEIVRLASKLIQETGFHNATMEKISEYVGIAKPTLYHYFKSKDEILFEIHRLYIDPLIESQNYRVENNFGSSQVVFEIIQEHLLIVVNSPGTLQTFVENQRELSSERRLAMKKNRQRYRALVEKSFQDDINAGVIPPSDPRNLAFSLFGMCNWASKAHSRLKIDEVERLSIELWRLFVFGSSGATRNDQYPESLEVRKN